MTSVDQVVSSQTGLTPPSHGGTHPLQVLGRHFLCIITQINFMTTSWGASNMRRTSRPRNCMIICWPCMGPGFEPTVLTMRHSWGLYSRRYSVIVDNIPVTVGWDHAIITQLLNSGSRHWPWSDGISSCIRPYYGQKWWAPLCGLSNSMHHVIDKASLEIEEYVKIPEHKFSGVEFQIFQTD